MRRPAALVLTAFTLALATACPPSGDGSDPDFMKPPEAYQPKTADLTFNEKNLEAFVMMSNDEREAHIAKLKESKGSYKGQAMSKTGAGLGEGMEDAKHGEYELNAVTEPIWFEVTLDYHLFTTTEIGSKIAPNRALEFSGTLISLDFYEESKPRKLVLKVACDSLAPIPD